MGDEMYNRKLESLQQYIPFLDNMIAQLKDPSKKNREQQLNKMQSLHAMITDKRKKLKLETLIKCEDVISKLYEKVHNKPIGPRKIADDFLSTPASPSPPREIIAPAPLTIPTERLDENRIPRIDIYSSAGESLSRQRAQQSLTLGTKVPDMSKPPISLDDLKTLEEDVQEKINEVSLNKASLHELNSLREKLTEQIQMEEVLSRSPQKHKKDELECINTTVRNNLNLTKKVIQPPEKSKSKDITKFVPNKPLEHNFSMSSPKKEIKNLTPTINKSPKILKEPASIFGSILSNIDDQILEGKKKKEERRSSVTGKDEKKPCDKDAKKKDRRTSKDDTNDAKKDKDLKKKDRSSSSTEEKNTTKEEKKSKGIKELDTKKKEHHQSGEKSKSKIEKKESDNKEENKNDKNQQSSKDTTKNTFISLTGKTSFEAEEERLKKELESKNSTTLVVESEEDKSKNTIGKISVKKDLTLVKANAVVNKEEEPTKQTTG
ncbi:cylicin-1-like [Anoplophora glabripennis]|uniref:cylicin-1-like n=1 Tax=Anoplophora glabripennis TaxID=217634 RepID=UPI000C78851D|nr:cylicin-1-like [Anoplophora glabripennis]